jgi:hypothetical protein
MASAHCAGASTAAWPACGRCSTFWALKRSAKPRRDIRVLVAPDHECRLFAHEFEKSALPRLEIGGVGGAIEPQDFFLHARRHQRPGAVDMRVANSPGTAPELLREHRAVHGQHGQFAEDRRAPDARPEMPAIVAEEQGVDGHHAAHRVGMFDRPGEGERAAEIVCHEIERPLDRGGVQELFDELRQAVERTLEIGRHFRMAKAWQARCNDNAARGARRCPPT